MSESIAMLP